MSDLDLRNYTAHMSICRVEPCDRDAISREMCSAHWKRWRKTGEIPTTAVEPRGAKVTGYHGVHHRLRAKYGRARDRQCECGRRATMWAYNHADPNELTSPLGPYSVDLTNYDPMCTPCHRKRDEVDFHEVGRAGGLAYAANLAGA